MSKQGSEPFKDLIPMALENDGTKASKTEDASEEAQRTSRIRVKNRRKMYLDRHPSYFDSPDLELAGMSTPPQKLSKTYGY
jgi:hypothetical protein